MAITNVYARLGCSLLFLLIWQSASADRYALLVGVGNIPKFPLHGPKFDVAAMQKVLTEKWQFAPGHIRTLLNEQGTKKNILAAVNDLYAQSKPDDEIFVYLSGHGTSALDSDINAPLPTTSGAYIPYDVRFNMKDKKQLVDSLVVGRNDLRPLLKKMDEGGRHVFVAIDACYSGNTVRGAHNAKNLPPRAIPADKLLDRSAGFDDDIGGDWKKIDESYPYKNIYYLSASGEYEVATDIPPDRLKDYPTIDNKPHGSFTDTLLKVLDGDINADTDNNGNVSYTELKNAVRNEMRSRGFNHTPQALPSLAEDAEQLSYRSIFGARGLSRTQPEHADPSTPQSDAVRPSTPPVSGTLARLEPDGNPVQLAQADPTPTKTTPVAGGESQPIAAHPKGENGKTVLAPLKVKLDARLNLQSHFKGVPGIQWVQDGYDLSLQAQGGDVLLLSGAGDLVYRLAKPSPQAVVDSVVYHAWVHRMVSGPSNNAFTAELEYRNPAKVSTAIGGEQVAFTVRTGKRANILIYDMMADGTIAVLYPINEQEAVPLEANRVLTLNKIDVTEPYGRDTIQMVALVNPGEDYALLTRATFAFNSALAKRLERLVTNHGVAKAHANLELITAARKP